MTAHHTIADGTHGFHAGERAVQRIAGVQQEAARLEGMLAPAAISAGMASFLAERTFASMTARDHDGRLWTSPLVAAPGFLRVVDPRNLQIRATPALGDPLHALPSGQPIGLIAIDYLRRRRFRLNGTLTAAGGGQLEVAINEAFGNCPQFIPQLTVDPDNADCEPFAAPADVDVPQGSLTDLDKATIVTSTSFLLGTTHPERGNDVSHRGGAQGFVRLDGDTLWWPDYPGNNLFNSLGNLQADPEAALLFPDFAGRSALHLHGTAELALADSAGYPDEGHTGRRVVFTPKHHTRTPLCVASELVSEYPRNPPVVNRPVVLQERSLRE